MARFARLESEVHVEACLREGGGVTGSGRWSRIEESVGRLSRWRRWIGFVRGVLLVDACGGILFLPEERDWRRGWLSRCFDTYVSIESRVCRVQRCFFAAHVRPARQADRSPFTHAHTFTGGSSLSACCCFFDGCSRCRRPRLSPVVATAWRLASRVWGGNSHGGG